MDKSMYETTLVVITTSAHHICATWDWNSSDHTIKVRDRGRGWEIEDMKFLIKRVDEVFQENNMPTARFVSYPGLMAE